MLMAGRRRLFIRKVNEIIFLFLMYCLFNHILMMKNFEYKI